jgi:hypothetical protein
LAALFTIGIFASTIYEPCNTALKNETVKPIIECGAVGAVCVFATAIVVSCLWVIVTVGFTACCLLLLARD